MLEKCKNKIIIIIDNMRGFKIGSLYFCKNLLDNMYIFKVKFKLNNGFIKNLVNLIFFYFVYRYFVCFFFMDIV